MGIERRQEGPYVVLDLEGDFRGGEENYSALRDAGFKAIGESPYVALNCRRVSFLDSQTLGLMVQLLKTAQGKSGDLALTGVTKRVSKWFTISGLDRLFNLYMEDGDPEVLEAAPPQERRCAAVDSVDVDLMVSELQKVLGEADDQGEPSSSAPTDPAMLTELEKLLQSLEEEQG